jgi:excisionase family DNA binding protein
MQQTGEAMTYPEIMNSREAGEFLRLHYVTVNRMANSGEIPGKKFGKVWRFRRSVLEKMMMGNEGQ